MDGSKSEVSQEDTASEAEVNTEEPLNGDEGEEEGLARDECEDELVREAGWCIPPAKRIEQGTTVLPELVKTHRKTVFFSQKEIVVFNPMTVHSLFFLTVLWLAKAVTS